MRLSALSFCIAAIGLAPHTVEAESRAIATLKSICGPGSFAQGSIVARAKVAGFLEAPTAFAQIFASAVPNIRNHVIYWRLYDRGLEIVFAGESTFPGPIDVGAATCGAIQVPASPTNVEDLQAYLGVGEPTKSPSGFMFVYRVRNGARAAVDPRRDPQFLREIKLGAIRVATTIDRSNNGITSTGAVILELKPIQHARAGAVATEANLN